MRSTAANIGVVLAAAARDAVAFALSQAGHEVQIAATLDRVRALVARNVVDAWIFDARDDDVFELLLPTGCLLLPADDIPQAHDTHTLVNWAEGLLAQVHVALASRATPAARYDSDRWSQVQGVWLLAGSAGATSAVQAFLNGFERPPPVAFLYAQHLDPSQHHQLHAFTVQNTQFTLSSDEGVHVLKVAGLVMVSPLGKVVVTEFGLVITTREDWGGQHTPDINELLVILSAAKLPSPGAIIFSGMGNDGAAALPVFHAAGGRIWAQSPASAICGAMPQAAIDTGLVGRADTPEALAAAMTALYPS